METELLKFGIADPTQEQLLKLEERCKLAFKNLRKDDSEVTLPFFVEFSGSPKSGKTSIIAIIEHFLRRMAVDVVSPAEGASLRTPRALRDDLLNFNAWSGCYGLQQILQDAANSPPFDLVLLDRGLFDAMVWAEFLYSTEQRITATEKESITDFFHLDPWWRRINMVFLFTCDHRTSIAREMHSKLTRNRGAVMNESTLSGLKSAYSTVRAREIGGQVKIFSIDTSEPTEGKLSFMSIAYSITDKILSIVEDASRQMLLVTNPISKQGFVVDKSDIDEIVRGIINNNRPIFEDREHAESNTDLQQIVPYAILENDEGKFFWAQRRKDARRKELRNKITLLVGGHAEKRDWTSDAPEKVFENCLRRELSEELIGLQILEVVPIGFIHDTRSKMGQQHLAFIHRVKVGGRTGIRRQAIDQEFSRTPINWKTAEEIKESIAELDPWSQLVASKLFDAALPEDARQPVLFDDKAS